MNTKPKSMAACHPDRPMMAHKLCEPCYKKQYRVGYYAVNKDKWVAQYGQRFRDLRDQVFQKLGNRCCKCGFSDSRAFQIDHVFGGGNQEHIKFRTSRNLYLKKVLTDNEGLYQLLCANCNWIKRHENREFGKYREKFDADVVPAEDGLSDATGSVEPLAID